MSTNDKRPTLAQFKAFLRRNRGKLWIRPRSSFDGMTDGCEPTGKGFSPIEYIDRFTEHQLGIEGLWLVGSKGGNRFQAFEDDRFVGFTWYNCCGWGEVAIQKGGE